MTDTDTVALEAPPPPRRGPFAVVLVLAAIAVIAAVFAGRRGYFTYDEWWYWTFRRDLLDEGGVANLARFLLSPHNGHVQALVWLTWLPIDLAVGMRSYLPYLVPTVVVHGAVGVLLYSLVRRHVRETVAVGFSAVYLFLGAAVSVTSAAFTLGEVVPMAATMACLLVIDRMHHRSTRGGVIATFALVGAALAAASGIGLIVLGVVAVAYGLRGAYRVATLHVVVFGAGYLLWLSRFETAEVALAPSRVNDYANFALRGIVASGQTLVRGGWVVFGAAVAVLAVVAVYRMYSISARFFACAAASLLGAVAFYALVAIRGVDLDPASYSPDQGRYLYVAGTLMLPALAWGVGRLVDRDRRAGIVCAVLALWVIPANAARYLGFEDDRSTVGIANRASVEAAASMVDHVVNVGGSILVADGSARISAERLARLDDQGKLPCWEDLPAAIAVATRSGFAAPDPAAVSCAP